MLYVTDDLYTQRLSICRKCPHYNLGTRSCGRLILGDTVKHGSKEVKLCGCVMPVKAKLKVADCPLNKWSAELTESDRKYWDDLMVKLRSDPTMRTEANERQEMQRIYEKAFNTKWTPTNCSKCWQNIIRAVDSFWADSDRKVLSAEQKKSG